MSISESLIPIITHASECLAVTPILFFFIFGAQEEVFTVWRSWAHSFCKRTKRLSHRPRSSYGSTAYLDFHDDHDDGDSWSQRIRHVLHFPKQTQTSTGGHFTSGMTDVTYGRDDEKRPPSIPAHFLPSTIPISLSQGIQITVKTSSEKSYDTDTSLRPPPRQARSVHGSPTVEVMDSHPFRAVAHMPSLTALGSDNSSIESDITEIDGGREVQPVENEHKDEEPQRPPKRHEKPLLRPNTGESSRTFGC